MPASLVALDRVDDPALEPYARMRERDLARRGEDGRGGLFVAEGEVVVRLLAARGRFAIRSVLLEQRRVEAVRDVLDALAEAVPAYVVPQGVMDAVVGFPIHRGVLALGERGEELDTRAVLAPPTRLVVGIVGVTNHDNVGGIFRNAAAFGAGAVLYDASTCDPLYRKAVRVSVGAALMVPFARVASAAAMLEVLGEAGFEVLALTPRGELLIDEVAQIGDKRVALLVGAEGEGLPDDVLARARGVRIAMAPGFDSLNVAVASAVALHDVTRGWWAPAAR